MKRWRGFWGDLFMNIYICICYMNVCKNYVQPKSLYQQTQQYKTKGIKHRKIYMLYKTMK